MHFHLVAAPPRPFALCASLRCQPAFKAAPCPAWTAALVVVPPGMELRVDSTGALVRRWVVAAT